MINITQKFNTVLLQEKLLLFAVVLTPVLGIYEVSELVNLDFKSFLPDIKLIKGAKDFVILLIILAGLHFRFGRKKRMISLSYIIIAFSIVFSLCLSVFFLPLEGIVSGIRWLFPLFFYLTLGGLRIRFLKKLTRYLEIIIFFGLLIQLYQLVNMNGIYGLNVNGFSIRNPGYYLVPSSMAALGMSVMFFVHHFETSGFRIFFLKILIAISILLTASGSGILSLFLFFSFTATRRLSMVVKLSLLAAAIFFGIGLLPLISGRSDILNSPSARVVIFFEQFSWLKLFFSTTFGLGTNTFVNLRPDLAEADFAVISDSMINASIMNCGILFLLANIFEFFIRPFRKDVFAALLYLSVFLPFYISAITFELFPVNILMFIALQYINSANSHPFSNKRQV